MPHHARARSEPARACRAPSGPLGVSARTGPGPSRRATRRTAQAERSRLARRPPGRLPGLSDSRRRVCRRPARPSPPARRQPGATSGSVGSNRGGNRARGVRSRAVPTIRWTRPGALATGDRGALRTRRRGRRPRRDRAVGRVSRQLRCRACVESSGPEPDREPPGCADGHRGRGRARFAGSAPVTTGRSPTTSPTSTPSARSIASPTARRLPTATPGG